MMVNIPDLETDEKELLQLELNRFYREISKLRDELASTQEKLQAAETAVAQLEEDKKHHKCLVADKENEGDVQEDEAPNDSSVEALPADEQNQRELEQSTPPKSSCDISLPFKDVCNLILLYESKKQYQQALDVCNLALRQLKNTFGSYHPSVARILSILAFVFENKNDYPKAERMWKDAMNINRKTLGYKHERVLENFNNLAITYWKQNKFLDAERLYKKLLKIKERIKGRDHLDLIKILRKLASLCKRQDKHEECIMYYRRTLKIYEQTLPPDNERVIKMKSLLADRYYQQGQYKKCAELFTEILTLTHKSEHDIIDENNKPIWQVAEELQSNENVQSVEYGGCHKLAEVDSLLTINALTYLGAIYEKQRQYVAAEVLYKHVLTLGYIKEFGKISENNKSIWQIAEEREKK